MSALKLATIPAAILLSLSATLAVAQTAGGYPHKPIRFVVPYTPGGGTDLMARALAQRLTENM